MGITEIVLLILGIGIFAASFILPEKKEKLQEEDRRLGEEQIRELAREQMKETKQKLSDVVDETITYAMEKTERSMERITNEKIMAVSEYSNTVLEEIHKNHEEAVFLYDMLNDKHQNLKDTAAEVEKKAKEAKESAQESAQAALLQVQNAQRTEDALKEESIREAAETAGSGKPYESEPAEEAGKQSRETFTKLQPEAVEAETVPVSVPEEKTEQPEAEKAKPRKRAARKPSKARQTPENRAGEMPEVTISFASSGEDGRNNNEKILELHKAGRSNMAIAKELGLGIGEVKLVIDLFKGV